MWTCGVPIFAIWKLQNLMMMLNMVSRWIGTCIDGLMACCVLQFLSILSLLAPCFVSLFLSFLEHHRITLLCLLCREGIRIRSSSCRLGSPCCSSMDAIHRFRQGKTSMRLDWLRTCLSFYPSLFCFSLLHVCCMCVLVFVSLLFVVCLFCASSSLFCVYFLSLCVCIHPLRRNPSLLITSLFEK